MYTWLCVVDSNDKQEIITVGTGYMLSMTIVDPPKYSLIKILWKTKAKLEMSNSKFVWVMFNVILSDFGAQ